jgi:hypothetical protein
MRRTCLLILICSVYLALTAGEIPAQDSGSGILFTGCPESLLGGHCDSMFYQVVAVDLSTGKQCPEMKYILVDGPGEIDENTGLWQFHQEKEDLPHRWRENVEIAAYKGNDTTTSDENCRFLIAVDNRLPFLVGGNYQQLQVPVGDTLTVPLVLTDEDWCDDPQVDSVRLADPASGSFAYDPESKIVTFVPDSADAGKHFDVYITISSGPVTRHCTLHISVAATLPTYIVRAGFLDQQIQGQYCDVPITLEKFDPQWGMGGFDFLLGYDASALSFQLALEGDLYDSCEWEYFTYRYQPDTLCGEACPSGLLRIIGIAETNNGATHPNPACTMTNPGWVSSVPTTLARIRFLIGHDRTLEGAFLPVRFFWQDCGDNVVTSAMGDRTFLSYNVYDYGDDHITDTAPFPTYQGAQEECVIDDPNDNRYALRAIDFHNGGIQILAADSAFGVGDINQNGIPYEIADAQMFSNYFVLGLNAFDGHVDGSVAASDVTRDGKTLTVEDFVYLTNVMQGDALPYNQLTPSPNVATFIWDTVTGVVDVSTLDTLGAVCLVRGEGYVTPALLVDGMAMHASNGRIFIYSLDGGTIVSGDLLSIRNAEGIVSIEAATYDGRAVTTAIEISGSDTPTVPYSVRIGAVEAFARGNTVDVPVTLEAFDLTQGLGGFDLQIGYDVSMLSFQLASEGALYDSCAWEYFTYRFGLDTGCERTCPTGRVRVVGLAESISGNAHPSAACAANNPGWVPSVPVTLLSLRFLTANDERLDCWQAPLRFYWTDCSDNTLANFNGSELYLSSSVYGDEFGYDVLVSGDDPFPTFRGAQGECVRDNPSQSTLALRRVDYHNGEVRFICVEPVEVVGDVNLNGITYEEADAIMFRSYFVDGTAAFGDHVEGSTLATDVNGDSVPLTVEDYQYLFGVMVGGLLPGQQIAPSPNPTHVYWYSNTGNVYFDTVDSLGVASLLVEGTVTPVLYGEDVDMVYRSDSGWTKILIYTTRWGAFIKRGLVLEIPGAVNIVRASVATYDARAVTSDIIDLDVATGDINLNDISYEIADAVMFANYFVQGTSAFIINAERSTANSDIDRDGIPLELQDFVFLLRIIVGDMIPQDSPPQTLSPNPAYFSLDPANGDVFMVTEDTIGAVVLSVRGQVDLSAASTPGQVMASSADSVTTIVVSDLNKCYTTGLLITLPGATELLSVQAAACNSRPVNAMLDPTYVRPGDGAMPAEYALHANYPNPFNPVTNIAYDLLERADVMLTVYNVVGQKVRTLVDRAESAGRHEVAWDGRDDSGEPVSSGIYLYRMTAGDFSQSRKMLLLK